MKALIMSDAHIVKNTKTGEYWCRTAVHGYDFWKRYLNVFEDITVVARMQNMESVDDAVYTRADGKGVHFIELPFIRGTKGYLKNYFKLKRIMKNIISDEKCGIFRLPSLPTFMLLKEFKKTKRPYAIEVIVDPEDAYSRNIIAKIVLTTMLKKECKKANGVSYVTKDYLELKYPSHSHIYGESKKYFNSYYSSIKLDNSFFYNERKYECNSVNEFRIIHIASAINSDVKGHSTLLKVVKNITDKGIKVSLRCIGDGDRRRYYEEMAKELGISNEVRFLGLFSKKDELRKQLIDSDLMLFPSRAEGLPRVVIEAMATGLPVLSTPVNGIPELLEDKYLFDPDDVEGFSKKIISLISNKSELQSMSINNYNKAHNYSDTILQSRRDNFYKKLRLLSE
ncbi:glycosyltransferase family 4 protein [uncultured Ruminococcus sp.]|uniref:glycosyltransferase family 4 protein n=1 Tax=uncultured Ruminococcus sp. TaxID=165186 RepID=UPI0025DDC118|nr:glycosyltransferase family 4 protein [uncultured Ruminococcus sp.]